MSGQTRSEAAELAGTRPRAVLGAAGLRGSLWDRGRGKKETTCMMENFFSAHI